MAVSYDPLVQREPYAAYRELRATWPVYRHEERGFWALSRVAPLARLQGRIVLEEALAAMPAYRLAGPVERIATHNTRGVAPLPIAAG